jgi:hypothetical protein
MVQDMQGHGCCWRLQGTDNAHMIAAVHALRLCLHSERVAASTMRHVLPATSDCQTQCVP